MYSNLRRLYIKDRLIQNSKITVIGNQHHYLKNVIRVKESDYIRLFNGEDGGWLGKIVEVKKKLILLMAIKKLTNQKNSPDLCLFFSPIKKDRINILVQKSTELGIRTFVPVISERSNIKKLNIINLQKNALEAAEQSERLDIPKINELIKLSQINDYLENDRCLIFCDERDHKHNNIIDEMYKIKKQYKKWSLIIGPEGGFSTNEKKQLLNINNIYPVSLGKRILRSDTAATAALFCIQKFING